MRSLHGDTDAYLPKRFPRFLARVQVLSLLLVVLRAAPFLPPVRIARATAALTRHGSPSERRRA